MGSREAYLKSDSPEIWTKEAKRIEQITHLEDKINFYKESGQWGYVLNAMEDYLRFQMEAIEEKTKISDPDNPEAKPKTVSKLGLDSTVFKNIYEKLMELQKRWEESQRRTSDPAFRVNRGEDTRELILEIKETLNKIYHNNVVYALTYKKKDDPMKAAYQ